MKPTTASIDAARRQSDSISEAARCASVCLSISAALYKSDVDGKALESLRAARDWLITLRRTQSAALRNIDEAIASTGELS